MARIPFGVSRLDSRIGDGAPAGSVVLLAGEAGAGARELLYTSAAINGLAKTDAELFDLYYGDLGENASLPEEIHYLSFTDSAEELRREMLYVLDDAIVSTAVDAVTFADLSAEYFQLSPVPRSWYAGHHGRLTDLQSSTERTDVIEALADYLDEHAANNLLLVDSLSDLVGIHKWESLSWPDVVYLLKGIRRASQSWGGLILIHVDQEPLTDTQLGDLMSSVDGTMLFDWEVGGNERARTMVVREFRGVLSQLEEEDIIRFETEIHEGGFDISDVRKIR